MAIDETHVRAGPDGTETAPLLRGSGDVNGYGSSTNGSSSATAGGGHNAATQENGSTSANGDEQGVDGLDGHPGMAKKLHYLMPAIAIGIFLSALDQTLIVATYAKMSSDLEALNRTSWISTA